MNAIELLKSKIAKGEITAGHKTSNPIGEGTFKCVVSSADFADNQAGTGKRAMIKYKVLENLSDPSDTKSIGGLFNTYIATKNADYMEQDIATYAKVLEVNDIDPNKMYEDATTLENIIEEIASILSKCANRNKDVIVNIERKLQDKKDSKGHFQYWSNIYFLDNESKDGDVALEMTDVDTVEVKTPAATKKPWA